MPDYEEHIQHLSGEHTSECVLLTQASIWPSPVVLYSSLTWPWILKR